MPLNLKNRAAMLAASAAALAMVAQPAAAAHMPQTAQTGLADISVPIATSYSGDTEIAHQYRRYDRYNRRSRYRRNRVSTGDVIAGVLILGAIAAITGGGKDKRARERAREENRDYSRNDTRNSRGTDGYESNGLNSAVNMCADQIERGNERIANVDNASRNASGWSVSGSMEDGQQFSCQIDNEGRIRNVDIGRGLSSNSSGNGRYSAAQVGEQGTQHSDDVYARARATNQSGQPAYTQRASNGVDEDLYANDPRPAYPGGPLPGEAGYDDALGG